MRFRRRRAVPPAPAPDRSGLAAAYWESHDAELLAVRPATMLRRLPGLVRSAVALAWAASRRDTAAALGGGLAAGLFTAWALLATSDALASLFAQGPTPGRVRAALPGLALVAVATALRGLLLGVAGWARARLKPQVELLAERRLFELTTRVELTAFDDHGFNNAMLRARDSGVPDSATVVETTVTAATAAVGVLAPAVALGLLQPLLMPLLLVTAVPAAWAAVRSARLAYEAHHRLSSARRRKFMLSDLMAERAPAAEVRSFGLRAFLLGEHDRVAGLERRTQLRVARRQAAAKGAGDALTGAATLLVYLALGGLLSAGVVPLGVAGAAVLAVRAGQSSLTALVVAVNRLYEAGLYFADYLAFLDLGAARTEAPRPPAPRAGFRRLAADGVAFAYPGADRRALDGVSVHAERGEVIALVGENGSGKTTLAKLLAGLYRPDAGTVTWDGADLARFDGETVRRRVSVIAQDHTRWPLTVRENIVMGAGADEERLAEAAAAAGADQVLAGLADGYDALLDRRFEGGHDLSGGQWQRIAAARGFYRDAALVIFDEPTSALDARAEHALFERIRAHAAGRTVVLITHRLASVRFADRIYVLDGGRVVEQGTHEGLMDRGGLYADLYGLQAAAYRVAGQEVP
ncbi:ABC transporter ATP-binding protein [Actinomadura parmotrematis]|uniref:ABC transporter ATP-binding protein/permease n=1 Tax=Actinomadura parmotrematis TaxID=2864039 RepID=A0ABS7FYD8_9ACTN|nr:ABC transporter ATP-binding protein [Actinomadura parmotrematis]MBW8485450.1 ABC transporter ATP-binding protein/permease [Actinomadura parmotrematis]